MSYHRRTTGHRTSKEGKSTHNSKIVLCRHLHLCWAFKISKALISRKQEQKNILQYLVGRVWEKNIKVPKCTVGYLVYLGHEGGGRWEWKDRNFGTLSQNC